MEAVLAERGQFVIPKVARDALGLLPGMKLDVQVENGKLVVRKRVDDAVAKARGRFKLDGFDSTDAAMRAIRGRAPGDPLDA